MPWVLVIITALVVVGIALVSVGGVTARLAQAPPPTLFDLDEAVEYVAERLPFDVTAQLSYDDVRALMGWHLDYLEAQGAAAPLASAGELGPRTEPTVLAEDDEGVAYVLGRAAEAGLEVDDVAVVEVIGAEGAYLAAIGAIGGALPPLTE